MAAGTRRLVLFAAAAYCEWKGATKQAGVSACEAELLDCAVLCASCPTIPSARSSS